MLGNGEPSIRRLLNLALCNRLPAFWEGREITEEGGDYICIAPNELKRGAGLLPEPRQEMAPA